MGPLAISRDLSFLGGQNKNKFSCWQSSTLFWAPHWSCDSHSPLQTRLTLILYSFSAHPPHTSSPEHWPVPQGMREEKGKDKLHSGDGDGPLAPAQSAQHAPPHALFQSSCCSLLALSKSRKAKQSRQSKTADHTWEPGEPENLLLHPA